MPSKILALAEPKLLEWARRCLNMSIGQAARKIRVKEEQLESWEDGITQPTIAQLRKIANVYKKPIATFYMSEPPHGYTIMRDFRRAAEVGEAPLSSGLCLEIQNADTQREIVLDLYRELEYELPVIKQRVELSQDRESVAVQIRELLKITRHEQVNLQSNYDALRLWKGSLEKNGIIVFQSLDVGTDEMLGFSITTMPLPAIVVNGNDWVLRRIFTLIHEFVHVLLRVDGLCDLFEDSRTEEKKLIEQFCNGVAGAVLVPEEYLMLEDPVLNKKPLEAWSDDEINGLADKYKVSREVIVRRLLICGRVTTAFYKEKRDQYRREPRRPPTEGYYPSPATNSIRALGEPYIRLVFSVYNSGKITLSDMSDLLGVRTKHFSRMEREVFKRGV